MRGNWSEQGRGKEHQVFEARSEAAAEFHDRDGQFRFVVGPRPTPRKEARCKQCGKKVSPVEAMMGPVCGKCTRRNHKRAIG